MAAGASTSSASAHASEIPVKFRPSKSYEFPVRTFGTKGEKRSFRSEWCAKYDWLHYDRTADAAFCHLCLTTEREKRFLASTKRDPAFISKGYTNWKDATTAFSTHLASQCHKEAVAAKELPMQTGDVGEKLSREHQQQKAENRAMFRRILQNVRFLARQGLPLSGHGDGADSNFTQLLHLRAFDSPAVLTWMKKKTDKYTSLATHKHMHGYTLEANLTIACTEQELEIATAYAVC